jgi:TetR/AcrR family transcriptional repressor of nem operon
VGGVAVSRPKGFEESQVLEQAMKLFWSRGYSAAGIKEVERVTGVRSSSLYHHFGSKEGLFIRVLDVYIDNIVRGRCEKYLGSSNVLDGFWRYFASCNEGGQAKFGCLLVNTSVELGPHSKGIAVQVQRGFNEVKKSLKLALIRAQQQGEINSEADVDLLATHLSFLLSGILANRPSENEAVMITSIMDVVDNILEGLKR